MNSFVLACTIHLKKLEIPVTKISDMKYNDVGAMVPEAGISGRDK